MEVVLAFAAQRHGHIFCWYRCFLSRPLHDDRFATGDVGGEFTSHSFVAE